MCRGCEEGMGVSEWCEEGMSVRGVYLLEV